MSATTDPLLALRQAIKSRTPITYATDSKPEELFSAASHIVLSSNATLSKTIPTRLRRPGLTSTDPSSNPQDFFTLGAVYLAWKLRDASVADYMKQARENGLAVGFVSVTERKTVVDWLEGRAADLADVVPLASTSFQSVST